MMVFTAKLKKSYIAIAILAIAAIIGVLTMVQTDNSKPTGEPIKAEVKTNDDRVKFLEQFGWIVSDTPIESGKVHIPDSQDDVTARYNELQKSQGYDLTEYAGKTAERYVYEVSKKEEPDIGLNATILIYRGKVIGGDISSREDDGIMHGFSAPDNIIS